MFLEQTLKKKFVFLIYTDRNQKIQILLYYSAKLYVHYLLKYNIRT